jgi:hypothetical protein
MFELSDSHGEINVNKTKDYNLIAFKFNLIVNLKLDGNNYHAVMNIDLRDLQGRPNITMTEMVNLLMSKELKHRVAELMCERYPELNPNMGRLIQLVQGTPADSSPPSTNVSAADPDAHWDVIFYETGCSCVNMLVNDPRPSMFRHLLAAPNLTHQRHHIPRATVPSQIFAADVPPIEFVGRFRNQTKKYQQKQAREIQRNKATAAADEDASEEARENVRASAEFVQSLTGVTKNVKKKNRTRKVASSVINLHPTALLSYNSQLPRPPLSRRPSATGAAHPPPTPFRLASIGMPGIGIRNFIRGNNPRYQDDDLKCLNDSDTCVQPDDDAMYQTLIGKRQRSSSSSSSSRKSHQRYFADKSSSEGGACRLNKTKKK